MVSELQAEIRDNISGFLAGHQSLAETENWLWPFLGYLADSDEDDEARKAVGTIGSIISERSHGCCTDDSMRAELASAIRPFQTQQSILAANDSGNPTPIPIRGSNVHFNAAA